MAQFFRGDLAARHRRARLHFHQRDAVCGRRSVPRRADRADQRRVGKAPALLPRGVEEGRARRGPEDAVVADFARAGLHRSGQRGDRRPANRQAVSPRDHAHGRIQDGRGRAQGGGLRDRSRGARDLHQIPQDAQRCGLRSLHAGDSRVPEIEHHHRPAGRLRARAHHRRLPPRGAVWRGSSDRGEEGGARADRRPLAVGST